MKIAMKMKRPGCVTNGVMYRRVARPKRARGEVKLNLAINVTISGLTLSAKCERV